MGEITLEYPVTIDKTEVKKLNMRRPKVRDQLTAEEGGGSAGRQEVRLFANLCEVTPKTIEELDVADYDKVQKEYTSFLPTAPNSADKPA
jgi:hypothetical protein